MRMTAVVNNGIITAKSSSKSGYVPPSIRTTTQTAGHGLIEFNDRDFPSLSMSAKASGTSTKMDFKKVVNECIEKEKANLLTTEQDTVRSWSEMTLEQREKAGIISICNSKRHSSTTYQANSDTYEGLQE